MIRIKTQIVLQNWGNIFYMATLFDSIAKSRIRAQPKVYGGAFLEK